MGMECARLGIPVLLYEQNWTYPNNDFAFNAASLDEYGQYLEQLIVQPPSINDLISGIRFYSWRVFMFSLDLSYDISADENTPFQKIIHNKDKVARVLSGESDFILENFTKLKNSQFFDRDELTAILEGIARLFEVIFSKKQTLFQRFSKKIRRCLQNKLHINFTNFYKPRPKKYSMLVAPESSSVEHWISATAKDKSLHIVLISDNYCSYIANGKVSTRMSKLLVRLATIYRDNSVDA